MKEFTNAVTGEMGNEFYQDKFDKICEALEQGNAVWLYCWCTGHTRCAMVERRYLSELQAKYGDRLLKGSYREYFDCYYLSEEV